MTHTAAGAEGHLGILDVESGRRKQIDRTSVVEMHMSQNDITNECGIDPYAVEYVSNRGQDHASRTPRRSGSVHPSIDDDYAWRVSADRTADDPDEIVKRHWRVVRIDRDEIGARCPIPMGCVAQREHFVVRWIHRTPLP
jgi:hypothetical protein